MNTMSDIIDGYMPKPGKTLVEAFKAGEIEVGDYVTDYNSKLKNSSAQVQLREEETGFAGTQTYRVDNTTTWRVLGLSADETQLVLTTGSPIKKVMNSSGEEWEQEPYLHLEGAEGYYHTNDDMTNNNILDQICKIYDSGLASEVKSLRIDDINSLLGITVGEDGKIYKNGNPITASQSFIGEEQVYGEGNNYYAPENYLKEVYGNSSDKYYSEYQELPTKKAGDEIEGSVYMYMTSDSSVIDSSSKLYEVLFDGTTSDNYSKSYWLASSAVGFNGSICFFSPGYVYRGIACAGGLGLFSSSGGEGEVWFGVRPVVYLNSNVTVNDLTISKTGEEAQWTYTLPSSFQSHDINAGRIEENGGGVS